MNAMKEEPVCSECNEYKFACICPTRTRPFAPVELGRCRTCQHWSTGRTLSAVRPDGDVMTEHGPRKLLHTSTLGWCAKMVDRMKVKRKIYPDGENDVVSPLDAVVCDAYQAENQWGSGGTNPPQTGPDFGCIHWEAKRPNNQLTDAPRSVQ